jgi:hypothetical protein
MQRILAQFCRLGRLHSKFQDTTQAILDRTQIHYGKLSFISNQALLVDRPHLIAHRNRIWPGGGWQ